MAFSFCLLAYCPIANSKEKKRKERRKHHNDDNHYKLLRRSSTLVLCVHFSRFILTKCINRLHVSTSSETSLFFHTHIYSLSLSCLLAFFSLTYSSWSFHLIVHPHSFLIRFAGRTREHRTTRRLLFFFSACGRLVFCIIVVLLFFLLRLHRRRRRLHFVLTQLHIHHPNDQQLRVE